MKKIITTIFLVIFVIINNANTQVYINKIIQENQITNLTKDKFMLVDFWATWCIPCKYASIKLEGLQEKYHNKVYIISISGESVELIESYLAKHKPKLAIANDFDNLSFNSFNTSKTLPSAVLLNQQNEIVWSGNPNNLNEKFLESLLQNKSAKSLSTNERLVNKEYQAVDENWHINTFEFEIQEKYSNIYIKNENGFTFEGTLKDFLLEFLHLNKQEINVNDRVYVKAKVSNALLSSCDLEYKLNLLSTYFHIEKSIEKSFHYVGYYTNKNLFWNTNTIQWDEIPNTTIETDLDITINNATLKQFSNYLSKYLNMYVEILNSDCTQYDWQIPHKYKNLMFDEIQYTYGIELKKQDSKLNIFTFSKK